MAITSNTAYTIARSPLNGTDGTAGTSQISVQANDLNVDTTLSLFASTDISDVLGKLSAPFNGLLATVYAVFVVIAIN